MDRVKANLSSPHKSNITKAINRLRNKSPQIQAVLRERWKKELKEKRSYSFDQQRYRRALEQIQLKDSKDDQLQQTPATEYDLLVQEYERNLQEEIETAVTSNIGILCPVCQKDTFVAYFTNICCPSCDYTLNNCKSLEEVQVALECYVDAHSENCKAKPCFTIVHEENEFPCSSSSFSSSSRNATLYMICEVCSWLTCIP